mgnify:CR=1 FL=1
MTVTISVILNLIQNQLDSDFRQNDDSRAVIPDLIRNRCYCQKTVDPDFRQGDGHNQRHSELDSESLLVSEERRS